MIVSGARELKGTTVLEDGTRVYKNYVRYKPLPKEQRKYGVRKPDRPGAVLFQGGWYFPLVLAPEEGRELPLTRPDTDAYDHMFKPRPCRCDVCKRPEAQRWKDAAYKPRKWAPW